MWILSGATSRDLIAKWKTSVGRKTIQFYLESAMLVGNLFKKDAKTKSAEKQLIAILTDYIENISCEPLHSISSKGNSTSLNNQTSSDQSSPVNKIKYWVFTCTKAKTLGDCIITNLSVGKYLNLLAAALKSKRTIPMIESAKAASEHEIQVYYNEALLEYNNVFKEAHQDRQVEEVKAEAKKVALDTFMKCAPAKQGSPLMFKTQLNSLVKIFHHKDKLLRNPSTGKVQ